MRVEWTDDCNLVLETITHPSVYPFVSDDSCANPDEFSIPEFSKDFFTAACYRDNEYLGCFCFFEKTSVEAEIHTCMLPHSRGLAKTLGDMVLRLLFKTKPYSIVSTFVPENNILAKKLAIKCGFSYDSEDKPIIMNGIEITTHKYICRRGDICL